MPDEVEFQTKPQIALDLIDRAKANGIRVLAWTADEAYGRNTDFLDGFGNNGCAARVFSALSVSTVISAHRVRSSPGSSQATDVCGAELALAWCQQPGCRAG